MDPVWAATAKLSSARCFHNPTCWKAECVIWQITPRSIPCLSCFSNRMLHFPFEKTVIQAVIHVEVECNSTVSLNEGGIRSIRSTRGKSTPGNNHISNLITAATWKSGKEPWLLVSERTLLVNNTQLSSPNVFKAIQAQVCHLLKTNPFFTYSIWLTYSGVILSDWHTQ